MKNSTVEQTNNFFRLRHKWEMPLIWTSGIVSALCLLLGFSILLVDASVITKYFGEEGSKSIIETAQYAVLVLLLPIFFYIFRFYTIAKAKSNAIRVGSQQLPKLWAVYNELAEKLEMTSLPKLYVINGNGVINAYAMSCNKRYKYIVMHAEIAMLVEEHPDIVEFVLAHEMAHHKLNHVSLWRIFIGVIPNMLKPLGISTTRAQEYSADRVALSVCNHHHQGAMKLLAIGPWMHGDINPEAWLAQCDEEHKEFYIRFANLFSDHAVMVKRLKALHDIDKRGFNQHGEMF